MTGEKAASQESTPEGGRPDEVGRVPTGRSYTTEHEWVVVESSDTVRVGVTDFAQRALGDVVYVSVPAVGASVVEGEPMGEVESTKSVADVFAPVSGTVVAANPELVDSPELVNSDPYGKGWIVTIKVERSSPQEAVQGLLDAAAYVEFVTQSS